MRLQPDAIDRIKLIWGALPSFKFFFLTLLPGKVSKKKSFVTFLKVRMIFQKPVEKC